MHTYFIFTNCSIVVLEKAIPKEFYLYHNISMLNFESPLGTSVLFQGSQFNNFESTLSEDACIVKSQIVELWFLRRF